MIDYPHIVIWGGLQIMNIMCCMCCNMSTLPDKEVSY